MGTNRCCRIIFFSPTNSCPRIHPNGCGDFLFGIFYYHLSSVYFRQPASNPVHFHPMVTYHTINNKTTQFLPLISYSTA